jgi:hypothetical protein
MKFIDIFAALIVTFIGSSCAARTEKEHSRRGEIGKRKLGKKSAAVPDLLERPKYYSSLLGSAQVITDLTTCSFTNVGMGNAYLRLYEGSLCVLLTFLGLGDGDVLNAGDGIHIKGPAAFGNEGPKIFEFATNDQTQNMCFALTGEQKKYLDQGLLYFDIYTNNCNKQSELRGQIFPV